MDPTPNNEFMRDIAARATASAAIPEQLRHAQESLPAFEDRAVHEVLKWIGKPDLHRLLRQEAERISESYRATFDLFHRVLPEFPARLTAGRLRFHYDNIATELLNAPVKTPMWSAWVDAQERIQHKQFGLVFIWPRVHRCRGWCVFHNLERTDATPIPWPRPFKPDPAIAFRLVLPIQGMHFSIEPLPAFLAYEGWLRGAEESEN